MMDILIAFMVGLLFASGMFLLMGSELRAICMGVFLISHGANLAILASSRSPIGKLPPILPTEIGPNTNPIAMRMLLEPLADPLPQALVLTAIVIGFAVQAFLLTLLVLTYRRLNTIELDELENATAPLPPSIRRRSDRIPANLQPTSNPVA